MSVMFNVWLIGAIAVGVAALFVALMALAITAGTRDRGEARFVLLFFGLAVLAPLWFLTIPGALLYAGVGLWSDADPETLAQCREREREAGIR